MLQVIRTTILGGVAFLIPVVVVVAIAGQAIGWIRRVTDPLLATLPESWIDHPYATVVVAIVVLLAICFAAGLVARTHYAQRLVQRLESRILARIPFYTVLKTRAEALLQAEQVGTLRPIVVRLDDAFQLAFEVERLDGEYVAVFVPGAPDPWAGAVLVVAADRVSALDLSVPAVEQLCHRLGLGSRQALGSHFVVSGAGEP